MTSKSKSKHEEALQFLDDLDSFTPLPDDSTQAASSIPTVQVPGAEGEAEALAFLDEIAKKSTEPITRPLSRSATPSSRKPTERVKLGGGKATPPQSATIPPIDKAATTPATTESPHATTSSGGSGGWGWGSVWTSASAAIQQAKTVVDEQVKHLPKNEQAKKWGEGMLEYAKTAQLDRLGQDFKRVGLSTLTDILNAVAPPISEHEVIQVWLSHDMKGYDGIESLVYRALARIMEQVEGGDLIVNRGEESRPKDPSSSEVVRDINAVDSYETAIKLAQANLDELIKLRNVSKQPEKEPTSQSPVSYSHVYLRVQPFLSSQSIPTAGSSDELDLNKEHLQFLLYFLDPAHSLTHVTLTQAVPANWLEVWDQYEWVEDLVAEALRVGVEVVGQEYVVARMGWGEKNKTPAETQDGPPEDASKGGDDN